MGYGSEISWSAKPVLGPKMPHKHPWVDSLIRFFLFVREKLAQKRMFGVENIKLRIPNIKLRIPFIKLRIPFRKDGCWGIFLRLGRDFMEKWSNFGEISLEDPRFIHNDWEGWKSTMAIGE